VRKMTELLLCLLLVGACGSPTKHDGPDEQAPEPIGPVLLTVNYDTTAPCSEEYLYREGRAVQSQCFDQDGKFSYEKRGTLAVQASTTLDAELAAADLEDTEPVNYEGGCGLPDYFGIETLWIGDQNISFEANCLIHGIVPLYEHSARFDWHYGIVKYRPS
jgi:hypothetical protein